MLARFVLPLLIVCVLAPRPAARADGTAVVPTRAQLELYERARVAFDAGRHDEAVELLRSANRFGELNILYLALGRAHFRAGRCRDAVAAYDRAETAPAVQSPSLEEVRARISAYRADLQATCSGTLRVQCAPAEALLFVDGTTVGSCLSDPVDLDAGEHTVAAELHGARVTRTVQVVPLETAFVELDLEPALRAAAASDLSPPPLSPLWGWGTLAGGALALGAAAAIDLWAIPDAMDDFRVAVDSSSASARGRQSEVEALQTTGIVLYAAGAVAVAGGCALLWLTHPAPHPENFE